jgi:hypothetical protein
MACAEIAACSWPSAPLVRGEEPQANQGAGQVEQALQQVGAPLVADPEAATAGQPRLRPFHHPPVLPQPLARIDPPPGQARGDAAASYPLSPCSLAGRFRGRPGLPRGPMMGGIASTNGSSWVESCALAVESRTASGMPFRSTTTWYLVPAFPRSVGFGPVCSPPFSPGR